MKDSELFALGFLTPEQVEQLICDDNAVVVCDVLPPKENLTQVVSWNKAIEQGYKEPQFSNAHALYPHEKGEYIVDGKPHNLVAILVHESFNETL